METLTRQLTLSSFSVNTGGLFSAQSFTHACFSRPSIARRCLHARASATERTGAFKLKKDESDMAATSAAARQSQHQTEWMQKFIELPAMARGCHIITPYITRAVPEISQFQVGMAHIFVQHTSASLTINENASADVPLDMNDALDRLAPESSRLYRHLDEGSDDMPAHVKASLMGSSLTVPIAAGRLALGTWQGIWLNEHRNYGGPRQICITIHGQKRVDGRAYGSYTV